MSRIKEWHELTIQDNFLFQKVMQNPRICKRLIEKLLGIRVKSITYPEAEKTMTAGYFGKDIRLDLFVETDTGTVLDIEMQTTTGQADWLPKRTRYYQSMIDINIVIKGDDYTKLKTSFVIFICTFDPFGGRRFVYTFRNRCVEENCLELGDGTTKIFLNTKGTIGEADEDIKKFLAYVDGHAAEGKFTQDIAREVEKVKLHEETRLEYMTLLMEMKEQKREGREEGRREGRREGREEERLASIRSLMKKLHMTAAEAMNVLDIPATKREKYAARL